MYNIHMTTMIDAQDAYRQARRAGLKYMSERHNKNRSGFLGVLETLHKERHSEIPLGTMEAPIKKIAGTMSIGRSTAFSGNFMPILDEGTEFAVKWRSLYTSHINDGIREPVKVYEYLGLYYVIEGNKRVSVLAFSGAYSVPAHVTRILPPRDEQNPAVAVFYELLNGNNRALIGNMWFSAPGRYPLLVKAASDAECSLEEGFFKFRELYHELGYGNLPITTGDAFLEYVKAFGFPADMKDSEFKENIKKTLPQFKLSGAAADIIKSPDDLSGHIAGRSIIKHIFGIPKKLTVAFAYSGTPETHFFARAHDAGRRFLASQYPELDIKVLNNLPEGRSAYEEMSAFVKKHSPDILFCTNPPLSPASLRVALENKNTTVLQCRHSHEEGVLPTYYGKTEEAAFICGALAGSLTRTGLVATIKGSSDTGARWYDVQAFAQGARFIKPSARVYYADLQNNIMHGWQSAREYLARRGCDIAWVPYVPGVYSQRKTYPGVMGHLCALDPLGNIVHHYAGTAWHWEVFYQGLIEVLADPSSSGLPPRGTGYHFLLGTSSGLIKVHPLYPAMGGWSRRLLDALGKLLDAGDVSPMDETVSVELYE